MSLFRLKRPRGLRSVSQMRRMVLIGVVAALCIALTVTVVILVRNDREVDRGRTQLESGVTGDLAQILRVYTQFGEPRADLQKELLPEMNKYLYSAYAQNATLIELYGPSSSILSNELYTQIDAAITQVDREVSAGSVIDSANNALTPYMVELQAILAAGEPEGLA